MRKASFLPLVAAIVSSILTGCGMNSFTPTSTSSADSVPVSLTMTDDPPSGVSVLFFQVSLTDASLTPATGSAVSLLSNNTPIQIDVTKLQALSAFLSTANVPAGTYNSLSLTFASPQLVIFNASDQSIASTCAVGTVCQLTPTIDNSATVTLSSDPFPVTVAANSPLGFLVDFHLNTIIQSDLSVNLAASNGVTVSQLPQQHPRFGSLAGTVASVTASSNEFTVQTLWGKTFTIDSNTSTTYDDFPTSACMTGSISCLAVGQFVQVDVASVVSAGTLLADQVTYLQAAGQETVEGTIVGFNATQMKLILHDCPSNNSDLPLGGEATVTFASGTTFSVDANGFTIPAGMVFTGTENLAAGQEVQVNVATGTLTNASSPTMTGGWGPPRSLSFTTNNVELEPSQITGSVASIDSTSTSFTLGGFPNFFSGPWANSAAWQAAIDTTTQTTYQNFTTDSFSGLATGDIVSVNGWLFETDNGLADPTVTSPVVLAQTVTMHSNGW